MHRARYLARLAICIAQDARHPAAEAWQAITYGLESAALRARRQELFRSWGKLRRDVDANRANTDEDRFWDLVAKHRVEYERLYEELSTTHGVNNDELRAVATAAAAQPA